MARREVTGRKPGANIDNVKPDSKPKDDKPPPPRSAFSIIEFCKSFGISEDFFYKLKRQGKAPRLMKVGARTMVSVQAADEWRIEREAEAEAVAKINAAEETTA